MTENLSERDATYAMGLVRRICDEVGPGLPGSPQERERAAILAREMEAHLGAEAVAVETFTLAPAAAVGGLPITVAMTAVAVLLNHFMGRLTGTAQWLASIAGVILALAPLAMFVFEFYLGLEVVDPLFKKRESVNVIGRVRRPGTGEVKRLLIVSGHHDSAYENTWLALLGYGFFGAAATMLLGWTVTAVMGAVQLAGVIGGSTGTIQAGTLPWPLLVYPILPSMVAAGWFSRGKRGGGVVPGAADNLSASALAVALGRYVARNPEVLPPETELRLISFGSEEAGLRGSRRYVERHLAELRRLDVRVMNFEIVVHREIGILTSDVNGTVRNAPEMVRSAVAAAERAGVPYKVKPAGLGVAGDAGPFSRAGLKAATMLPFQVPQQQVAFYHQRADGPEVLTAEPLLNGLKLALEWVRYGGEDGME